LRPAPSRGKPRTRRCALSQIANGRATHQHSMAPQRHLGEHLPAACGKTYGVLRIGRYLTARNVALCFSDAAKEPSPKGWSTSSRYSTNMSAEKRRRDSITSSGERGRTNHECRAQPSALLMEVALDCTNIRVGRATTRHGQRRQIPPYAVFWYSLRFLPCSSSVYTSSHRTRT
jgi:hypothetical protein